MPGWLSFWVCFAGVAGKTALKPDSVATYGVAVGVGVVVAFDDWFPHAASSMASDADAITDRLTMPSAPPSRLTVTGATTACQQFPGRYTNLRNAGTRKGCRFGHQ